MKELGRTLASLKEGMELRTSLTSDNSLDSESSNGVKPTGATEGVYPWIWKSSDI